MRPRSAARRLLPDRGAGLSRPRVEILYVDDCPHHEEARALVERVAAELAIESELELVHVSDVAAARQLRFLGSPTVRVNGVDVEPGVETRGDFVLSCRIYRGEHGLSGRPRDEWVRDALAEAVA